MNFKKKMRRSSLAALIALALTSSALAMPTGGEVVRGGSDITLSGGTWDAVANNATITANNDGQINWQTFNILGGETLNFNIANDKTLLNQVTGTQLSEILGTLNQTGGGDLVLVNPNGIHIGGNAVLNVQDLTLSALGVQVGDPDITLRQSGDALVNIDGAATFNFNKLSIFGGKVNVADGVVFNMGSPVLTGTWENIGKDSPNTEFSIKALSSATITERDGKTVKEVYTHSAGNDVTFAGKLNLLYARDSEVTIGGAKTTIKGASFNDPHKWHTHWNSGLDTTIYAASQVVWDETGATEKDYRYTVTAGADNVLTVDGLTVTGAGLTLAGGTTDLKNVAGGTAEERLREVMIAGIRSHTGRGGGDDENLSTLTAPDRTINIAHSRFDADEVHIYGGKVTVAQDVKFDDGILLARTPEQQRDYDTRTHIFELVAGDIDHENGKYTTTAGNDIVFHGDITGYGQSKQDPLVMLGSTIDLGGAAIGNQNYLNIGAVRELSSSEYGYTAKMSAANTLTAKDGTIFRNVLRARLLGGKVSAGKSTAINVKTDPMHEADWMILAGREYTEQKNAQYKDLVYTYRSDAGNTTDFHGRITANGSNPGEVSIVGHSVNADGARLSGERMGFDLDALSKVDYDQTAPRWQDYKESQERTAANMVTAKGLEVSTKRELYIAGGSVRLTDSTLSAGGQTLAAYRTETGDGDTDVGNRAHEHKTMGADNVVYLENSKILTPENAEYNTTRIHGGTVTMKGTEVDRGPFAEIYAGASHDRVYSGHGDQVIKVEVTKNNVIDLRNTKVSSPDLRMGAGKIGVYENAEVSASRALEVNPEAQITKTDAGEAVLERDKTSNVLSAGQAVAAFRELGADQPVPPEPKPPTPPVNPDVPRLSEDDTSNIAEGNAKAQDALVETTQEKRAEALTKTVTQLNEKVGTSRRQTAGVVVGIVQEIANAATLSDGEKVALVESVLNAYAPVQEAKTEQDNVATNTLDEAANAVANVSAAPAYPDETEAEEVVSFAS